MSRGSVIRTATLFGGAHFLQAKWSATRVASMATLMVATLLCSLGQLQAGPASSQPQPQPVKQQQQQAAASATATAAAGTTSTSSTKVGPPARFQPSQPAAIGRRRIPQQVLDAAYGQLLQLESAPSDTLEACAHWYQLNQRYSALAGGISTLPRETELRKRAECDTLDRFYGETRAKLASFKQLLGQQGDQLDFAVDLTNEYLDLKYAASVSPQLAAEFEATRNSDNETRFRASQLEQFIQFMASSLNPNPNPAQNEPQQTETEDELNELDTALKQLINSELSLSPTEFSQLRDLGDILERILADGHVELSSGRFRYLMGTLDAVHSVILHKEAREQSAPLNPDGLGGLEPIVNGEPAAALDRPMEVPRAVQFRRQARRGQQAAQRSQA